MQNSEMVSLSTLQDIEKSLKIFCEFNPSAPLALKSVLLKGRSVSYEDFLRFIYEVLDHSVYYMQKNSRNYRELDEVALTNILIKDFHVLGINALPEVDNNGHCDITIEIKEKRWIWLGEAKIHKDYDYLHKGLNQLLKRYSVGDEFQDHGGVIIYIKQAKGAKIVKEWRERIIKERKDCENTCNCDTRPDCSFTSFHPEHEKTGLPFYVKHIGILMHYHPDDDNR